MTNQINSLRIGLLDNSYHSLKRGYEMWSQWKDSEDAWLLKESIIWVHHGIELALKQLLVEKNEFLVFDDINKAVDRLSILRRKKGMENAGVLDLFDHDDKVMSVGFRNLVERTAVTLSIPELTENETLRLKIDELTKYRNKVVHFSVELDIAAVSNLLSDILDPLLSMLSREVKDINFRNVSIPEIRNKARPVQKFSEKFRLDIVDRAIRATINAMPPKGNRKAGIVSQTIGSGLGSSVVSYLTRVRLLPKIRDNHVIILVNNLVLAAQIYRQISGLADQSNPIEISFLEDKTTFTETLESQEPKIIIATIQRFKLHTIATSKECLVIGYNLHTQSDRLLSLFPNAVYILFTTHRPQQDPKLQQIFGEVIFRYNLNDAVNDGIARPIFLEYRSINANVYKYTESDSSISVGPQRRSTDFIDELAQDIVEHFELCQKNLVGKGIVVVPDITTGVMLSEQMAAIKPDTIWVKTISSYLEPKQRAILLERFRDPDDPLSLLITTGIFLFGFDNPLVHTVYVTNPISLQLRYMLASLVSIAHESKERGLIVDYTGLIWDDEFLH